jgi:hypothetical protein
MTCPGLESQWQVWPFCPRGAAGAVRGLRFEWLQGIGELSIPHVEAPHAIRIGRDAGISDRAVSVIDNCQDGIFDHSIQRKKSSDRSMAAGLALRVQANLFDVISVTIGPARLPTRSSPSRAVQPWRWPPWSVLPRLDSIDEFPVAVFLWISSQQIGRVRVRLGRGRLMITSGDTL